MDVRDRYWIYCQGQALIVQHQWHWLSRICRGELQPFLNVLYSLLFFITIFILLVVCSYCKSCRAFETIHSNFDSQIKPLPRWIAKARLSFTLASEKGIREPQAMEEPVRESSHEVYCIPSQSNMDILLWNWGRYSFCLSGIQALMYSASLSRNDIICLGIGTGQSRNNEPLQNVQRQKKWLSWKDVANEDRDVNYLEQVE